MTRALVRRLACRLRGHPMRWWRAWSPFGGALYLGECARCGARGAQWIDAATEDVSAAAAACGEVNRFTEGGPAPRRLLH